MKNDISWFVYMLLCDNTSFYIGITNHLRNRFSQHKKGLGKSTKKFSQLKLVYCERYYKEHEAAMREKQLKGWSRAKKQMLIDGKIGINNCTEFAEALIADLNK